MEFSLTQLLGVYFIVIGGLALYRRKSVMPAISQLAGQRPLLLVLALVELLAGLGIVLIHPNLTADADGLVSLIGWMLIVEGFIYLAVPYKRVQKLIKSFNNPQWIGVGGIIALLAGLYLAGVGFGFIAG